MLKQVANGTIKTLKNQVRIYYDGYWIRYYEHPNNLAYKKYLIDQLTRRVFHHTEQGINTPGDRLEEVRTAYTNTNEPLKKRVLAAMLAGALLNRGSDILTKIVEMEEIGISIKPDNELLKECGRCFMGALEYGKYIRPLHGNEPLDEIWGEPFRAFTVPVEQYLESRYIKVAQTMNAIDSVSDSLTSVFDSVEMFTGLTKHIKELAKSAKLASETMRSDANIIEIWPRFVGAVDRLAAYKPIIPEGSPRRSHTMGKRGMQLVHDAAQLIYYLANIRTPMTKSTAELLKRCDVFTRRYLSK